MKIPSVSLLQVKVALFAAGVEVLAMVFSAIGSTKNDWFSHGRLEVHPWTDMDTFTLNTAQGGFFSILGADRPYVDIPCFLVFCNT